MYLFDKVSEFTQKFKKSWCDRKKSQALDNYSSIAPFHHKGYLNLIKTCMNEGFLGDKESDFLDYMLDRYNVNFLDWSHRTRWLKKEMAQMASQQPRLPKSEQAFFDWDRQPTVSPVKIPVDLIARQAFTQVQRRV